VTGFEVWAPAAAKVELEVDETVLPMTPSADAVDVAGVADSAAAAGSADAADAVDPAEAGWWRCEYTPAGAAPSADLDYFFRIDGGPPRPDPRSRRQPHGVHGPSRVDRADAFRWTDETWRGRPLRGAVLYELHIGTFTPEGTFDAAIDRLEHLTALGVDFVELMPVAAFNGEHGWGYDGAALWAVHEPYGGPDGLRRFVDACHARGLGVLLDVVYNHLGPSGNYLGEFGPYFTDAHVTPWGSAVNLDGPGSDQVRAFLIGNATYWLRENHLDGLRLDAVHALADTRAVHVLEELSAAVDALAASTGRHLHLIAETDRNDPRTVTPRGAAGGLGVHAQWSDDFHHALHAALTGERQGYYCDFGSMAAIAKTLMSAYFHNGTYSTFRGRHHGRPVDTRALDADRFVVSLQTHDQIGNRAEGDRISGLLSDRLCQVAAALLLTSPFTPQLFMGEEWGADTPWQYFTDHPEPDLAAAVRDGRRAEFGRHGWPPDRVPDPQAPETFARSVLDWDEPAREPHRGLLAWYRSLISLRRASPDLADPAFARTGAYYDEDERWIVVVRGELRVAANLSAEPRLPRLDRPATSILLASDPRIEAYDNRVALPPESVAVLG
jgi:maltooligosyltrehalose trehalohydrolase